MNTDKKIYILIPAFNEEKKIDHVIKSLKDTGYHNILVVNDGSTDNTKEVALKSGAEVLSHIFNRGQGTALRTGIEYLRENCKPDIIITFDADGQHQAEDVENLIDPIIKEDFDIVLGSRFLQKENKVPLVRKIILKGGIIFTKLVSDIKLTDAHNGIRALGKKAIDSIEITQRGMEHASEIVDEIKNKGLKHKEVPVKIIYSEYSRYKGQKSSNLFKIGAKIILKKFI